MEYWKDEGNNKRMQTYHKISNLLKVLRIFILMFSLFIFVLLITQSIIYLSGVTIFNVNMIIHLITDVYNVMIIMLIFGLIFMIIKKKLNEKELLIMFVIGFLLLPEILLLVVHFVVFGSFMFSFYYMVILIIVMILINHLITRIDELYNIATGSNELKMKEKIDEILFGEEPIKKKRIAIRKLGKLGLDKKFIRMFLKLLEYIGEI